MLPRSTTHRLLGLGGWLIATAVAGAIGGLASASDVGFYAALVRPSWAPPASLFGPVWSVLYLMMAVAAWLVWRTHGFRGARAALVVFLVQLAANALWTWLFFGWRQGGLALAELIVLWVMIVLTIILFAARHRLAAMMLVPYLLWVSFAGVLNYSLWRLNPGLL